MERVRIDTTQNVKIDYQLATIWDRSIAWLIDLVIIIFWLIFISEMKDLTGAFRSESGNIMYILLMILPVAFYHLFMEIAFNGQSVGKLIMKIKVVRLDGSQPGIGNYLLRWMMRIVEFLLFMGLALVSYLMSGRGQRLGDLFAGTTVIRKRRKYTLQDTILYNLDETYNPKFPQVRNFSNRDIEIIKEGLRYSIKHRNYNTVFLLNEQVSQAMGIENHGMPYAEFLKIVIQDFNYYQALDAINS